jgi:magnesium-transporting ATPase (P-type)
MADAVELGTLLLVRSGEKIALDGEVVTGQSDVDQSLLTGESVPVKKSAGHMVQSIPHPIQNRCKHKWLPFAEEVFILSGDCLCNAAVSMTRFSKRVGFDPGNGGNVELWVW